MRAEIVLELCQGHGQCAEPASKVFEVRDAAGHCPTDAIKITE